MGVSKRLAITDTIAPKTVAPDGAFESLSILTDVRPNSTQVITLTGFGGTDSFKVTSVAQGGLSTESAAFVRGTNAAASDLQTALRTLTGDTLLVVEGTTDAGPYTVQFSGSIHFIPTLSVTNPSGCTGAVTTPARNAITLLGESMRVSETDDILPPTIGTGTVTGGTNEVVTAAFSSGTDGGTFGLRVKGLVEHFAFDATKATIEAELADQFANGPNAGGAPTVASTGTNDVQTIELGDIAAADTYKLSAGGVKTSLLTYAADSSAAIKAALEALPAFAGVTLTVVSVDDDTYTVTANQHRAEAVITITDATGFTPTGVTATTPGVRTGLTFTFATAPLAGRPILSDNRIGFAFCDDALTDGGVLEPATVTATTPGVAGSVSFAYTENGAGDSVLASIFNALGRCVAATTVDAATPVVFSNLFAGTYTVAFRTVEDGAVSKPATASTTITSS